jgi:hypothetical protein
VTDRAERWLIRAGYTAVLAFPLAILLFHDQRDPLLQYGPLQRKSDILVTRDAHAVELLPRLGQTRGLFAQELVTRFALLPVHQHVGPGVGHDAQLGVSGCAYDTSPMPDRKWSIVSRCFFQASSSRPKRTLRSSPRISGR